MLATLAMIDELQGTGVKVNPMCPGTIPSTGITRNLSTCSRYISINTFTKSGWSLVDT